MIYTHNIQKAIRFSIDVHELNRPERQLRKGKNIAYITHPLAVGLILTRAGASEDVIIAGILHDTIEVSHVSTPVTAKDIEANFGPTVAELVQSVSETNRSRAWAERKAEALAHLEHFSHDSLLLKSGDILSNATELIQDYKEHGEIVFERFNASKEDILRHYIQAIAVITARWPENPLASDLQSVSETCSKIRKG